MPKFDQAFEQWKHSVSASKGDTMSYGKGIVQARGDDGNGIVGAMGINDAAKQRDVQPIRDGNSDMGQGVKVKNIEEADNKINLKKTSVRQVDPAFMEASLMEEEEFDNTKKAPVRGIDPAFMEASLMEEEEAEKAEGIPVSGTDMAFMELGYMEEEEMEKAKAIPDGRTNIAFMESGYMEEEELEIAEGIPVGRTGMAFMESGYKEEEEMEKAESIQGIPDGRTDMTSIGSGYMDDEEEERTEDLEQNLTDKVQVSPSDRSEAIQTTDTDDCFEQLDISADSSSTQSSISCELGDTNDSVGTQQGIGKRVTRQTRTKVDSIESEKSVESAKIKGSPQNLGQDISQPMVSSLDKQTTIAGQVKKNPRQAVLQSKAVLSRECPDHNHQTLSCKPPKSNDETVTLGSITERHNALELSGWSLKHDAATGQLLKVSPQRKLRFKSTWAAEVFEGFRQQCNGDEYQASELFVAQMKEQGLTLAELVMGGIGELCSHKSAEAIPLGCKTKRQSALEASGWVFDRNATTGMLLKVSPQCKLRFIMMMAAEVFEELRQHCNGDEFKASKLFVEQMKEKGYELGKLVVGGQRALSFGSDKTATDQQRHMYLRSKGWNITKERCGNQDVLLKISPIRKLKFISTMAAEQFVKMCEECQGDEYKASKLFMERAKEQGITVAKVVIGGVGALSFDDPTETVANTDDMICRKTKSIGDRHQILSVMGWKMKRDKWNKMLKVSPSGLEFISLEAAEAFQDACDDCDGDLFKAVEQFLVKMKGRKISKLVVGGIAALTSVKSKPVKQIAKTHKSRTSKCLAELSSGWKPITYKCSSKEELHFETPRHQFEFKSFRGAKLFDSILKQSSNEAEAMKTFVNDHGHDKVRGMVSNFSKVCHVLNDIAEIHDEIMIQDSPDEICPVDEDYWEVETIQKVRFDRGQMLCLVRWKGFSMGDTWEPSENLCDSALEQAHTWLSKNTNYDLILKDVLIELVGKVKEIDQNNDELNGAFYNEVTDDIAPMYSAVIDKPMCLKMIERKVMDSAYNDLDGMKADVSLMYSNCIKFNNDSDSNPYRVRAFQQREKFRKLYKDAIDRLASDVALVPKTKPITRKSTGKVSPKSYRSVSKTTKKRKQSNSKPSCTSPSKKSKDSPHCHELEKTQSGMFSVATTNKIGSNTVSRKVLGSKELSFTTWIFSEGAIEVLEVPGAQKISSVATSYIDEGRTYELMSVKVKKSNKGQGPYSAPPDIEYQYVMTEDNGTPIMNLQDELEKLVQFGSLPRQKVIARLGHLQSEVKFICNIRSTDIEVISEGGQEGCGFYPPGFFDKVDGFPFKNSPDVIQVRTIAPSSIGFAKGILLKKEGISRVQLPQSMIKVLPVTSSTSNHAIVAFKNLFAPSEHNTYFWRYLDPNSMTTPSFMEKSHKKLSKMYIRMLIGCGLQKSICNKYIRRAVSTEGMKHGNFMGVADPTGAIPYGTYFHAGYSEKLEAGGEPYLFARSLAYGKAFVSRSPSVEPGDAKILSVLQSKPKEMRQKDWDQLCSYKFGTIIFGLPKNADDTPIPNMVADGDLDGDLYFVLWDEQIMDALLNPKDDLGRKALRDLTNLEKTESNSSVDKTSKLDRPHRKDWLKLAQNDMADVVKLRLANELVGKLFGLMNKHSKRLNGHWDIYDEDSIAFAKAYKDAMDVQKHGGTVYLPGHLHEKLPAKFRHVLSSD